MMRVEDGAVVSATRLYAGLGAAQATIEIDDASWVNSSDFRLGLQSGSIASATVANGGTLSLNGNSSNRIGDQGTGTLLITQGGTVEMSSGSEQLLIGSGADSDGTLAFGGLHGQTAQAAGALVADSIGFGDGSGRVIFNHTDTSGAFEFGSDLSGEGFLSVESGTTKLTGNLSGFSGLLNATGGALVADDPLSFGAELTASGAGTLLRFTDLSLTGANSASVGQGATLQAGKVDTGSGSLTIGSEGTFLVEAIDTPVGGLAVTQVSGNVNLETQSRLLISATSFDSTPDLEIDGELTIEEGAYVELTDVDLIDDSLSIGVEYYLISASGGVTGTFGSDTQSGVQGDFAFVDPELTYLGDGVYLSLSRNIAAFTDLTKSANERAIAGVLETGTLVAGNVVYDEVLLLESGDVSEALNHMTGEVFPTTSNVIQLANGRVAKNSLDRLAAVPGGGPTTSGQFAFHGDDADPAIHFQDTRFWFSGFGAVTHQDGNGNAAGLGTHGGGFSIGLESDLDIDARIGAAFSYDKTHAKVTDRSSTSTLDGFFGTLYFGTFHGALSVSGLVQGGYNRVVSSRYTTFDSLQDELSADYGAWSGFAYLESAYEHNYRGFSIEPFAGITLAGVATESIVESGNAAALRVDSSARGNVYSTFGLRLQHSLELARGRELTLSGDASWRHIFGDLEAENVAKFVSGSDEFSVTGLPLEEDNFLFGVSAEAKLTDTIQNSISYLGQYGSASQAHSVTARVSLQF